MANLVEAGCNEVPHFRLFAEPFLEQFGHVENLGSLATVNQHFNDLRVHLVRVVVLNGLLQDLLEGFDRFVAQFQIKQRDPNVEPFVFLAKVNGLQRTTSNGTRLVDLGRLHVEHHVANPQQAAIWLGQQHPIELVRRVRIDGRIRQFLLNLPNSFLLLSHRFEAFLCRETTLLGRHLDPIILLIVAGVGRRLLLLFSAPSSTRAPEALGAGKFGHRLLFNLSFCSLLNGLFSLGPGGLNSRAFG